MWQLTELVDEFKVGVIARIKVEPIDPKDWQLAADTCFAFLEKPALAPLDQAQVHFILAGMCLNGDIAVQEDHLIIADDMLTWFEKEVAVGGQDVEKQDTEKQSVGEHDVGKQSAEGQSAEGQRVEDNGTGEQGAGNDSARAQYSSEEVPRNTAASADAIIEETVANQDAAANTVLDDQGFSDHGAVVGTDALDALDAKDDGAEHPGGSTKLPVRKKTISKSMRRREANDAFAERNTSKHLKRKAQQ
ncbi:hypothetical protein B0A48_10676 [Cryoendolithus antarcticus]|uniref:Uncharacterized protein n=1 Tax=Cryoendolithus antarcticus TaxID=1507870 RepID=A0A1V8SY01_9PEZI|nr:hypothetical protein B0A48_10676 [Cryoendolithus antarcticus]